MSDRRTGPNTIGGYEVEQNRLCEAKTKGGRLCRNPAVVGKLFCPSDLDPERPTDTPSPRWAEVRRDVWAD